MRLLLSIIVIFICSCATHKRCERKFPNASFSKDSTYTKDNLVAKTFTVTIPGEKIVIHDTVPCPELEYHANITKNKLTAKVDISKGKLTVQCLADSLIKVIEVLTHEITTYRVEKSKEVLTPEYSHKATQWDKFCYFWFSISAIVIIAWIYIKLKP